VAQHRVRRELRRMGGFFEHVVPPRAEAGNAVDPDIVGGKTLLGMRVPVVVASPWSAGNPSHPTVNSLVFDHTSVLKLIEWRWSIAPLTLRDASSDVNNLAYALNFNNAQTAVPSLPKPHTPFIATPCFQNLLGGAAVPATGATTPATTPGIGNAASAEVRLSGLGKCSNRWD
jgi:phospholipase C